MDLLSVMELPYFWKNYMVSDVWACEEQLYQIFGPLTPLFCLGSGYEVTFSKNGIDCDAVENVIKMTIPTSEKKSESAKEIVYRLPLTETNKFPELFRSLEEQKSLLGIENIGVSCTTMEQVFLK